MADYLFIDEAGKKTYLTTGDIYDKALKKGLYLADRCTEKGFNDDNRQEGLYCLCQGENAKIKMTLYRRGEHIVITSHHRIDSIRHMKGVCRHARNDEGKPYESAYMIDDEGNPVFRIEDIPYIKPDIEDRKEMYRSVRRDVFDPDLKEMTPTEFIRKLLIICYRYAVRSEKQLTSKYFYGILVNSVIYMHKRKDTFLSLLKKGKLSNDEGFKDNKVIIFGPVNKISVNKNVTRVNIKTNGPSDKYILSENDIYKGAADDFEKRYGVKLEEAYKSYNIVCFALTRYDTKRPMWLQFHMISKTGCYCDNIYEFKAYDFMSMFTVKDDRFSFYKPLHPEGGDYMGESSLIPAAYIIKKDTGEKVAIIEVFDGTDEEIKEKKLRSANIPVVHYDTKSDEAWTSFREKLQDISKNTMG